jgi:hypothetical protein
MKRNSWLHAGMAAITTGAVLGELAGHEFWLHTASQDAPSCGLWLQTVMAKWILLCLAWKMKYLALGAVGIAELALRLQRSNMAEAREFGTSLLALIGAIIFICLGAAISATTGHCW